MLLMEKISSHTTGENPLSSRFEGLHMIHLVRTSSILLLAAFLISSIAESEPVDKVRIGVSTPLTGDASTFGQDVRDILLFANETLAGGRYELVFEDDKCSAKDGATVASRFVNVLKIPYVIGLPCSASTLSAAPIYERGRTVTMVTWASSPRITQSGDFIFRIFPSDALAARLLSRRIAKQHKKIALLSAQNDYAQDMKTAFLETAEKDGLTVIAEDYMAKSPDLRSIILKLKSSGPEAVFLNTEDEAGFELALRAMRTVGWNAPVYGAYWPSSATLLKNFATEMEGVEFVDTQDLMAILNEDGKSLLAQFKEKYGGLRSSDSTFAPTYEGFRALHSAIQSGKDVRSFLYSTKFQGIFGEFTFDKNGESKDLAFIIKRIHAGKVETIVN